MNLLRILAVLALITNGCLGSETNTGSNNIGKDKDRDALQRTSVAIRAAFARSDVAGILEYHHPDVVKALAYNKFLNGREALRADLRETLSHVKLEWQENNVESLLIHGDAAVEMTTFEIKGTPKDGGQPFIFKGRAMVVYVRYAKSPTGWASIREVVQPAK
jgi:ketosteroid isomerase-like protein